MNILFVGDVCSRIGRKVLLDHLSELKREYQIDFTIVNIENAAGGVGVTPKILSQLEDLKIDIYSSGNHIWDKKEIIPFLETPRCNIVIPCNYPDVVPGKRCIVKECKGRNVYHLVAVGRVFMDPLDCPFHALDREVSAIEQDDPEAIIFVDFHAEATSEKVAMGYFLEERATVVVGTHTHVQTADEKILSDHTAYITDVGMTGPYESVIGVKKEIILEKFLSANALSRRFEPACGEGMINAVVVQIEEDEPKARNIIRVCKRYDV